MIRFRVRGTLCLFSLVDRRPVNDCIVPRLGFQYICIFFEQGVLFELNFTFERKKVLR